MHQLAFLTFRIILNDSRGVTIRSKCLNATWTLSSFVQF